MDNDTEQEKPLLNQSTCSEDLEQFHCHTDRLLKPSLLSPSRFFATFFASYALVITLVCIWIAARSRETTLIVPEAYSPANHIVSYQITNLEADPKSIFSSQPSDEHNQAWQDLLEPMYISASSEELVKSNDYPNQRLKLVDGGYLASLGIYHELHCLRRIYWHYHAATYFPNQTAEEATHERGHAIHCLESIRRSLMCSPNIALYSFKWRDGGRSPRLQTGAQRQCINWDALQIWAGKRATGIHPRYYRPSVIPQ